MPLRARHVCRFLQGSDAVAALLVEIERRDALLAHVRSLLPTTVARHCTQATLEEGRLTLICDSPAWVDRLRFLSPQVLSALAARGRAIADCRIRAQPQAVSAGTVARTQAAGDSRPAVSPDAARTIAQYASALGDSPLAASLRRLAATLRRAES